MPKRWRIAAHDPERIARLERAAGVPAVVAQLLLCRGISSGEQAQSFLQAKLTGLRDPDELAGAREAGRRIVAAIQAGQRIVVYGDYDADGMSATAILLRCLRLLDANVGFYVPNRMEEGYGLNDDALCSLAAEGTQLVVTVDCGIGSVHEARTARRLGMELIVTDHHAVGSELPAADLIVHPNLPDARYPFDGLSGAGVAMKVAWAVCQESCRSRLVTEQLKEFLMQAVGLAAIGTVADVVPLVDENRILVRHGLVSLRGCPPPGLAALASITGLTGKQELTSEDIAFTVAPRLNAAGRLGQAQLAVELMTTQSVERADVLAHYLNELNTTRDSLERSIYLAANRQAQEVYDPESDAALVLAGQGWHAGVIGIVAGRLADKYHRPVILIGLDEHGSKPGVGSARSISGFDLHLALTTCCEHLISYGGHAGAAGLRIDEAALDAFRAEFCALAEATISEDDRVAELWIDAEAPLSALSLEAMQQIERLAPFGKGNSRPVLCASNVRVAEPPRRIGGGGRHLSLALAQHGVKLRSVAFGGGDWQEDLARATGPLEVAFRPAINVFRGRRSVELQLADWRKSSSAETNSVSAGHGVTVPPGHRAES
jgi:single-stranded-DNA-specific exonuclease